MLLILALAILLAYARGIVAVNRSIAKPNSLSWIIWAAVDVILIITSLNTSESKSTIVLLTIYLIGAIIIASISWSNRSNLEKIEWLAIAVSILSIFGWVVTGNASVGLGLIILAHFCGTILTLKSVWIRPKSEDGIMWLLFLVGNIANLFIISWNSWQNWTFPVYETVLCLCIYVLTLRKELE